MQSVIDTEGSFIVNERESKPCEEVQQRKDEIKLGFIRSLLILGAIFSNVFFSGSGSVQCHAEALV